MVTGAEADSYWRQLVGIIPRNALVTEVLSGYRLQLQTAGTGRQ